MANGSERDEMEGDGSVEACVGSGLRPKNKLCRDEKRRGRLVTGPVIVGYDFAIPQASGSR